MSIAATYLQNIRVDHPSDLDRDELRVTRTGLVNMAIEMTNSPRGIISPDLRQKVVESEGLEIDIPVRKKGLVTIKNVRSCDVQCSQSETDLVRLVWKTVVADVCMVPVQYNKNQMSYAYDLAQKLSEVAETFLVEIENDLDTALDTNKTQVYGSTLVGDDYALVAGAIQVQEADIDFFFGDLEIIQDEDDFGTTSIFIVASPRVRKYVKKYSNQGESNDENTAYTFDGLSFGFSKRVTSGTGVKATGYFMSEASLGFLTRVDQTAKGNYTAGDGTEWMEDRIPGVPFNVGIKYNSVCSDQSAIEANGMEHLTATILEQWQISFDYGILTPYNSDPATKPSAIRKFEFV